MRPCFPLSAAGSGCKTQIGRCGARAAARNRASGRLRSPSAPTMRGRPSVGWTWQGERGEIPALGAPKKSARVAEATVLKPKIATMERRKASALRKGRAAARRN
jgi:hypothetical protein